MRTLPTVFKIAALLVFAPGIFTGCGTTDGGGSNVNTSVYYGVGFDDPWYYGGYYPPEVIVAPPSGGAPPGVPPPKPEHPIAMPPAVSPPAPRPMPTIPSRPMPRPAMRR